MTTRGHDFDAEIPANPDLIEIAFESEKRNRPRRH
jgi:hypothetical protein